MSPSSSTAAADVDGTGRHVSVVRFPVLALVALALGGFGIGATEFAPMGMLPTIAGSLAVDEPTAGLLVAAYSSGAVFGGPAVAAVAGRVSRTRLLVGLLGLFVLAHGFSALAGQFDLLVVARFLSGVPHGAYFGVASVVAVRIAPPGRQGRAVAAILMGAAVANVLGVPASTAVGQHWSWRWVFLLIAGVGLLTLLMVSVLIPRDAPDADALEDGTKSLWSEIHGVARMQVWLTLAVGVVGFGGTFALYAYINTAITSLSGVPAAWIPLYLGLYGIGMTLGNHVGGRLADWNHDRAIHLSLAYIAATLVGFILTSSSPVLVGFAVLAAGGSSVLVPGLQMRVTHHARGGESMAGALIHSAINIANGGGVVLGGIVLSLGWGHLAPSVGGIALSLLGALLFSLTSYFHNRGTGRADGQRRSTRVPPG